MRAQGIDGVFVEVGGVVKRAFEVVFQFQEVGGAVQVVQYELVRVFQRSALHLFVAVVVLGQYHAQFVGGFFIAFVGFAEELYQFRVGECAGKVGFAAILIQFVEVGIDGGVLSYVVHAIQHEVTAIDHCVQGLVYRFDVCVRSKDIFPAPDAAVCIGVTVYGVHEVGLEVG